MWRLVERDHRALVDAFESIWRVGRLVHHEPYVRKGADSEDLAGLEIGEVDLAHL